MKRRMKPYKIGDSVGFNFLGEKINSHIVGIVNSDYLVSFAYKGKIKTMWLML